MTCTSCNIQYVGCIPKTQIRRHISDIPCTTAKNISAVSDHFKNIHQGRSDTMQACGIERVFRPVGGGDHHRKLLNGESFWMFRYKLFSRLVGIKKSGLCHPLLTILFLLRYEFVLACALLTISFLFCIRVCSCQLTKSPVWLETRNILSLLSWCMCQQKHSFSQDDGCWIFAFWFMIIRTGGFHPTSRWAGFPSSEDSFLPNIVEECTTKKPQNYLRWFYTSKIWMLIDLHLQCINL